MATKTIPDGYHTLTPYLVMKRASEALDFYQKAFGAKELFRMAMPGGGIGHAEIQVGDSRFMLSDENPKMGFVGPETLGGSPMSLMLYVTDADRVFNQAVAAGATVMRPLQNQFYGDRSGTVKDPFGHVWTVATHLEDVPPEEMAKRAEQFMKACAEKAG